MDDPGKKVGESRLSVKRSKFYARALHAESMQSIVNELRSFRTKHRKARHICWAARVLDQDGALTEQMRDDGEVGRPGLVMLELLRRKELSGAVFVARYFGGVKLGVGGVSRAFREAAAGAIERLSS